MVWIVRDKLIWLDKEDFTMTSMDGSKLSQFVSITQQIYLCYTKVVLFYKIKLVFQSTDIKKEK